MPLPHVFGPRLVERRQHGRFRVERPNQFQRAGDQPKMFLFGQRQDFNGREPSGADPIIDHAPIPRDDGLQEGRDEIQHAFKVVFKEVEPVGNGG